MSETPKQISDFLDDSKAGTDAGPAGTPAFREAVYRSQEQRKNGGARGAGDAIHRSPERQEMVDGEAAVRTDRLLPCPFCGVEADLTAPEIQGDPWTASCPNCAAFMSGHGAKQAILRWNRRAPSVLTVNESRQRLGLPRLEPEVRALLARCLSQIECEWGEPDTELRAVLGVPPDAPLGTKPPEDKSC